MQSIERNDVDISKLFAWSREFPLKVEGKEYKVYVRLVGDAELSRARTFAFRKSAELRAKLRKEDSDERWAFIPQEDGVSQEELASLMTLAYTRYFTEDAIKEIKIILPTEPDSDASLEAKEEYQKEIDGYPIKRNTMIREFVEKKIEEKRAELAKTSKEQLYKDYVKILIDQLCENEMFSKFREMCTYFGIYKDKKFQNRLFGSFEEFSNVSPGIKEQFMEFYNDLEINGEELKKLPEVAQ
jgi:hypothetical protein